MQVQWVTFHKDPCLDTEAFSDLEIKSGEGWLEGTNQKNI